MEKEKSGFTVIEVSLVLALAGLIFLMVFLALPALQRSQRDTSRREAVTKLIREIKNYQSNSGRGNLPGTSDTINGVLQINGKTAANNSSALATSWAGFYRDYLGKNFVDPDGEEYNLLVAKCSSTAKVDQSCTDNKNQLNNLYGAGFPNGYKMYVIIGATCDGETAVATSNPRNAAVLYRLEGAGIYCSSTSL